MADMRESQGGALGEERDDFTLQSSVRGEEAKMVDQYLADDGSPCVALQKLPRE
jgi:hypothetical protein